MQSRLGAGPEECPSRHHHTRGMNTSYFRGSLYPSITSDASPRLSIAARTMTC